MRVNNAVRGLRLRLGRARPFLALFALAGFLAAGCVNLMDPQYKFAQVHVRVMDQFEVPIPGTLVVLYTGAGEMGRATTGESGAHTFKEIAAGGYSVYILPPRGFGLGAGEKSYVDGVTVEQGSRQEVTFVLYHVAP